MSTTPSPIDTGRHSIISCAAVFVIRDGHILLTKRQNTGYRDGHWCPPSGHMEFGETPSESAIRELKEEVGLVAHPDHMEMVHVMHRGSRNIEDRTFFFFQAHQWNGEPINAEPEKCSEIAWFPLDQLPNPTVEFTLLALDFWKQQGLNYSETFNER